MSANAENQVVADKGGGAPAWVGAVIVFIGLAAIAVSTVWTTDPWVGLGPHERYTLGLLGLALLAVAVIGRNRFASKAPARLLCALGAAACMRLAEGPLVRDYLPGLDEKLPMWLEQSYPGLAVAGSLLALVGLIVWKLATGRRRERSVWEAVASWCVLVLVVIAVATHLTLKAAGYVLNTDDLYRTVLQLVVVGIPLVVGLAVCGEKRFGFWPMIILAAGLLGHVARTFMGGGGEA